MPNIVEFCNNLVAINNVILSMTLGYNFETSMLVPGKYHGDGYGLCTFFAFILMSCLQYYIKYIWKKENSPLTKLGLNFLIFTSLFIIGRKAHYF